MCLAEARGSKWYKQCKVHDTANFVLSQSRLLVIMQAHILNCNVDNLHFKQKKETSLYLASCRCCCQVLWHSLLNVRNKTNRLCIISYSWPVNDILKVRCRQLAFYLFLIIFKMAVPSLHSHSAFPTHTQHFMSHAVKIPRGWCKDEVLESSLVKSVQGAFSPFLLSVNGSCFQATVYSTRARFLLKLKSEGILSLRWGHKRNTSFASSF